MRSILLFVFRICYLISMWHTLIVLVGIYYVFAGFGFTVSNMCCHFPMIL